MTGNLIAHFGSVRAVRDRSTVSASAREGSLRLKAPGSRPPAKLSRPSEVDICLALDCHHLVKDCS
jgi:hypothetical protein